jgi:hypothetical protein
VILDVLSTVALTAWCAWCFSSPLLLMLRHSGRRDTALYQALRTIRVELRPFRYVMVAVLFAPDLFDGKLLGWNGLSLGVCLLCCIIDRPDDDDDDRWKKRRKKLADKVAQVGGRLQVVPAGAPS